MKNKEKINENKQNEFINNDNEKDEINIIYDFNKSKDK